MTEKQIQQTILKLMGSRHDIRLFRNNVGMMIDLHGNHVKYGLCKGSADLIGVKTITITEDMVGQEIGVFLSIEVKSDKGKLTPEQIAWQKMVETMGGIGLIVRDTEELWTQI
jgi:hypothetical protein